MVDSVESIKKVTILAQHLTAYAHQCTRMHGATTTVLPLMSSDKLPRVPDTTYLITQSPSARVRSARSSQTGDLWTVRSDHLSALVVIHYTACTVLIYNEGTHNLRLPKCLTV